MSFRVCELPWQFDLATPADEPELRRLLRETPLVGDIHLALECEPSIGFASGIHGTKSDIVVCRSTADGAVVAMGSRSVTECYVNGSPRTVGYLSQLRVLSSHRARPTLLKGGFSALRRCHADGAVEFYVTTIVSDNAAARRVLEAGLPGFPVYRYVGDITTYVMPTRQRRSTRRAGCAAEHPRPEDLEDIVDCLARYGRRHQFAPCWTRDRLLSSVQSRDLRMQDYLVVRRRGRVGGCLACWDQRGFKQAVVRGYSRRLAWARPAANLLAPLTGSPRLPAVGEVVAMAFASHLAVDEDDPELFSTLVEAVLRTAAERRLAYVSLGLAERNPLTATVRRNFRMREYPSRVYMVHWEDGRAAVQAVDARPMHLEVAIL